jgi:hypothetical protein
MTQTLLLELDTKELEKCIKENHIFLLTTLPELLGCGVEQIRCFDGPIWEIADNLYGPHPIPTYEGVFVLDAEPVPGMEDTFKLTLDDGRVVQVHWDSPRLDDPDEILFYWQDRYDEIV